MKNINPHRVNKITAFSFGVALLASPLISPPGADMDTLSVAVCSIASPASGETNSPAISACGWDIPSWVKPSKDVNIGIFKNAQGKTTGNYRTASQNGTKMILERDYAGHGGSYFKLKRSGSTGYYSVSSTGKVLRWQDTALQRIPS